MHLSWSQHLELPRCIEAAGDQEYGVSLALMDVGIPLLLLGLGCENHRLLNVDIHNDEEIY